MATLRVFPSFRTTILRRSFHSSRNNATIHSKPDITTFNKIISDNHERLTLVDFYADWCGPCHQLAPILEKFASGPHKSGSGLPVDLVKVDTETDDGQALSIKHKVRALPTVVIYKGGTQVSQFVGAFPEAHVKKLLDEL